MIGDTIKKFREERGWTQEELATKMGYTSKSTINKIEKNINDISQTKIEKFARVFNCDPTDLITTSDSQHRSYSPEFVDKAIDFYSRIQNLPQESQSALLAFLDNLQTNAKTPHQD